jgi:hypothetical protein
MSAEALHAELLEIAAREQIETFDGDALIAFIGKKGFMTLRLMGMIVPCGCVDGRTLYAF